jgi:hypothetical protein
MESEANRRRRRSLSIGLLLISSRTIGHATNAAKIATMGHRIRNEPNALTGAAIKRLSASHVIAYIPAASARAFTLAL